MIAVGLETVTLVAALPPKLTVAPATKLAPVMRTVVPPAVGPPSGVVPLTLGAATNVYPFDRIPLSELGFVTVTATAPELCDGVIAEMEFAVTTTTLLADAPPNVAVAPLTKFVPLIMTVVPPAANPLAGLTPVTVGSVTDVYVNPFAKDPLWVSGFVTATVTAPTAFGGVVAVIVSALTKTTFVPAVPPNATVAPCTKPVPLMVTGVPPVAGPPFGVTLEIVGAA